MIFSFISCKSYYKMTSEFKVSEGVPLPSEWKRGGHAGGVVEGYPMISGGNNWTDDKSSKVWFKNSLVLKDGKWIEGPDLPIPLSYSVYASNSNTLFIAGGTSDGVSMSKDVYYIKKTDKDAKWNTLPRLPEGISFGAGVIVKDNFYIVCGTNGIEKLNTVWCLDLKNEKKGWKKCSSVPGLPRMMPAISTYGKYLYLIGGLADGKELNPLNDVFRYDTENDQWHNMGILQLKGYAWVSQQIDNDLILITGRADGTIHKGVWLIKLIDMSITQIASLVVPSTTAPLVEISKKTWWLVGGEPDANRNRTDKVSIINLF